MVSSSVLRNYNVSFVTKTHGSIMTGTDRFNLDTVRWGHCDNPRFGPIGCPPSVPDFQIGLVLSFRWKFLVWSNRSPRSNARIPTLANMVGNSTMYSRWTPLGAMTPISRLRCGTHHQSVSDFLSGLALSSRWKFLVRSQRIPDPMSGSRHWPTP